MQISNQLSGVSRPLQSEGTAPKTIAASDLPRDLATLDLRPQDSAAAVALTSNLAQRIGVAAEQVTLVSFDSQKGFNAGNSGFPVNGELSISAWTRGLELRFQSENESYIYRGLDAESGRFGVDVEHQGFWKADERGIYSPDLTVAINDPWN